MGRQETTLFETRKAPIFHFQILSKAIPANGMFLRQPSEAASVRQEGEPEILLHAATAPQVEVFFEVGNLVHRNKTH